MKVAIRTHVKNQERVDLLIKTIDSCKRAGFSTIIVIDDQSPLGVVESICVEMKVKYFKTTGIPSTKNGLYWSFFEGADLHVVDDCVLNPQILQEVENAKKLFGDTKTWLVSFFACYSGHTRTLNKDGNFYWHYQTEIFYAGIACCYHHELIREYMAGYEKDPYSAYQDDLTIKHIIHDNQKRIMNTMKDYAQHTGAGQRAFGGNIKEDSSNYISHDFIGEE